MFADGMSFSQWYRQLTASQWVAMGLGVSILVGAEVALFVYYVWGWNRFDWFTKRWFFPLYWVFLVWTKSVWPGITWPIRKHDRRIYEERTGFRLSERLADPDLLAVRSFIRSLADALIRANVVEEAGQGRRDQDLKPYKDEVVHARKSLQSGVRLVRRLGFTVADWKDLLQESQTGRSLSIYLP